ncbi:1989_t:CDS:1, partial [Gigaspora margarita]
VKMILEIIYLLKDKRTVHCPDLKNILLKWILQNQDKIVLNNAKLVEKAKSFAQKLNIPESDLKFSYSWLYKFKKWHSLGQITKHSEEVFVDENIIAITIFKVRELLEKYNLKDIYNIDETELFYW